MTQQVPSAKYLTRAQLDALGFKKTKVRISLSQKESPSLTYETSRLDDSGDFAEPGIYVSLCKVADDKFVVFYTGKAKKGPNARFEQHHGGYRNHIRNGTAALGTKKLVTKLSHLQAVELEVWFRRSLLKRCSEIFGVTEEMFENMNSVSVSTYSLEEEALIAYFSAMQYGVINAQIPRFGLNVTRLAASPTPTAAEVVPESIPYYEKMLLAMRDDRDKVEYWGDDVKFDMNIALEQLYEANIINDTHVPKIIGEYTKGPFRRRPLIVYGKLAKKNLKDRQVMFTTDGKLLSLKPFQTIVTVNDFISQSS